KASRALLVGAGAKKDLTTSTLRRIATAGALFARQRRLRSVAIASRPVDGIAPDRALQALVEGAVLANYEGTSYKRSEQPAAWIERVIVRVGGSADEAAVKRGRVLGEYTNLARSLSNEPGNVLTPRVFAERATKIATDAGLGVEVLDETQIEALKMGLLLG